MDQKWTRSHNAKINLLHEMTFIINIDMQVLQGGFIYLFFLLKARSKKKTLPLCTGVTAAQMFITVKISLSASFYSISVAKLKPEPELEMAVHGHL